MGESVYDKILIKNLKNREKWTFVLFLLQWFRGDSETATAMKTCSRNSFYVWWTSDF